MSEEYIFVNETTRQIFCCTTKSMIIEAKIPKPKALPNVTVKVAVCVIKPGPIAEVAIKKIALIKEDRRFFTKVLVLLVRFSIYISFKLVSTIFYDDSIIFTSNYHAIV